MSRQGAVHHITARPPRGPASVPARVTDPDRLRAVAGDAAHVAGQAAALVMPRSEREVADLLQSESAVLPIGAQSSLTGGATPRGDVVLGTAALNRITGIAGDRVSLEPGVSLAALESRLALAGRFYPPASTFPGAFVGGTLATNAAGAATFKYGTTRDWVEALTVVLPSGDVLDIERGQVRAHREGYFDLTLRSGTVRVQVPPYVMPRVPKVSAGYFAAPGMDLIDLFIGAEGTLGVIVAATLRTAPLPARCTAFVPFVNRSAALAFVRRLRTEAADGWRTTDPGRLDVAAIEHLDARCLQIAREDGLDRKTAVSWPEQTAVALLITLELPPDLTTERAFEQIGTALDPHAPEMPLGRFCRALDQAAVLGDVEIAVPGDAARLARLLALREEIPASVNRRVGLAKLQVDGRIEKTAGDLIVPFERLEELLDRCDDAFRRAHLDAAVWGHVSDGNIHPNVIPRTFADVERGRSALLELGRTVIRMGGSPLAEHGVGRSPTKQRLLEELYGPDGVRAMQAVKQAIDPGWKLARGVLFPPPLARRAEAQS